VRGDLLRLFQSLEERLDGVPFLVAFEEEFRSDNTVRSDWQPGLFRGGFGGERD